MVVQEWWLCHAVAGVMGMFIDFQYESTLSRFESVFTVFVTSYKEGAANFIDPESRTLCSICHHQCMS